MYPLRAIIDLCVRLRIHPNALTFTGVVINAASAWALAVGSFMMAGVIMIVANVFDFIDGKVAERMNLASDFGGFWDSVMDRFSDILLFIGLLYLYTEQQRADYVLITALALMFSVMTSYTRARAESLISKCKVGFMERPERIVLFMIGAFILVLSVVTVVDRIYFTWRELRSGPTDLHPDVQMVILVLSVVMVVDRIYFTWRELMTSRDLDSRAGPSGARGVARAVLDLRPRHVAIRPDGDRDLGVRLDHAPGMGGGSRRAGTGPVWPPPRILVVCIG